MKHVFAALLATMLALPLANCQTTSEAVTTKIEAVVPPETLYTCPLPKKPAHRTLTDDQVARYVTQLYAARKKCKASLEAIHAYSVNAAREIENVKKLR